MSYTEYNVGYRDAEGELLIAYVTWGLRTIALKRLAKMQKAGGCPRWVKNGEGDWVPEKTEALLIKRTISDPEVVEE